MVAFKNLKPKNFNWSTYISVNYKNEIISFEYDTNTIESDSIISFLVYDGDYFLDNPTVKKNNTNIKENYKTISKLLGAKIIKFNKSNNFTFTTDVLPNTWDKQNLIFFPFITQFKFGRFFTGYSIDLKKSISFVDTYTSTLKYNKCSSKSIYEHIEEKKINYNKITRYLDKNCFFYMIFGNCYINHHNSQIKVYINDKLEYYKVNNSDKTFGVNFYLKGENPYNSNTKVYFDFNYSGQFANYTALKLEIVQAIYEEVLSDDYEITCLVLNKGEL